MFVKIQGNRWEGEQIWRVDEKYRKKNQRGEWGRKFLFTDDHKDHWFLSTLPRKLAKIKCSKMCRGMYCCSMTFFLNNFIHNRCWKYVTEIHIAITLLGYFHSNCVLSVVSSDTMNKLHHFTLLMLHDVNLFNNDIVVWSSSNILWTVYMDPVWCGFTSSVSDLPQSFALCNGRVTWPECHPAHALVDWEKRQQISVLSQVNEWARIESWWMALSFAQSHIALVLLLGWVPDTVNCEFNAL